MENPLAEVSLELAEMLEAALVKEAYLTEEIDALKQENEKLKAKAEAVELTKKASAKFDADLLAATTSLERAGFFTPGAAINAYQALMDNPKEIPVLLEKLASALTDNFSEGASFNEPTLVKKASKNSEPNPWLGLLQ